MPDALFALLCGLDRFDLRNKRKVDDKTLAGHLARELTNLKDQTEIDASEKGLRGMCVCLMLNQCLHREQMRESGGKHR